MERFLAAHGVDVTGVIAGYDRLRLRGSLCHLCQPSFMFRYLCAAPISKVQTNRIVVRVRKA
jgi:hypothetical protein